MPKLLVSTLLCFAMGLLFCLFLWMLIRTGFSLGWSFVAICGTPMILSALLFAAADVLIDDWTSADANRVVGVSWIIGTGLCFIFGQCSFAPLLMPLPFLPLFAGAILGGLLGEMIRERRLKLGGN